MHRFRATALVLAGLLVAAPSRAADATLPFEVVPIERRAFPVEQVFDATIEAVQQATVSAQTSGRVIEVNFDIDDYVAKDTVIVRMRDKEQKAALDAARAQLKEAQMNYERARDLLERKLASKADFDKTEVALQAARAGVDQAQEQLEHTVVRAPYNGIVVERHIELGETASAGQPLMTGLSLDKLRADANVSQAYIDAVRRSGAARVLLPDGRTIESGELTVSPYADPQTHTFRVRVGLPDGLRDAYPGMFAKVAVVVGEELGTVVPVDAVVFRSEVTAVYVVDADGRVAMRQVRLGRRLADGFEVLAGLTAGDRVAVDPIRAGVHLKKLRAGR